MATSDQMAWAPESNPHADLFDNENMEALDDLFDFSQYGPSLLEAWDLPELEDGSHDEPVDSSMQGPNEDSFDLIIDATTNSQRDAQLETALDSAPPLSANSIWHSAFLENGDGVSTLLPQSEGGHPEDPIINMEDLFEKSSTANEFFGFDGNKFPPQQTTIFHNFPIYGQPTQPNTYTSPSANFNPSIFDLNPASSIAPEQFPFQRFTVLTDDEPSNHIPKSADNSRAVQSITLPSLSSIQFLRSEDTMLSPLPKKRYPPSLQNLH
jgi:hypothetical protein